MKYAHLEIGKNNYINPDFSRSQQRDREKPDRQLSAVNPSSFHELSLAPDLLSQRSEYHKLAIRKLKRELITETENC